MKKYTLQRVTSIMTVISVILFCISGSVNYYDYTMGMLTSTERYVNSTLCVLLLFSMVVSSVSFLTCVIITDTHETYIIIDDTDMEGTE